MLNSIAGMNIAYTEAWGAGLILAVSLPGILLACQRIKRNVLCYIAST